MEDNILYKKIKTKEAKIGIIGLGYVGLPLAILFAGNGFVTTGFVRSKEKANLLNKGESYINDPEIKTGLKDVIKKRSLEVKISNGKDLEEQDIIIICVPTPVNRDKKPDVTDLREVAKLLSSTNLKGKLIINESTVAPFMTRDILGNLGKDYYLACSPERIDPGNKSKTTENISKVIGGINEESLILGSLLYEKILKGNVVKVKSLEAAEMAKMLENTYRAVNIALINEFAKLAEKCEIDILDVINAAASKWSFQAHYPSIGVGGHCIPVDPYYILELAKKVGIDMKVVLDGLKENESMPDFIAKKVEENYKKGMKVLVYGITYKKDVNDLRESPVIEFCQLLKEKNINFTVYDPYLGKEKIEERGFKYGDPEMCDIFVVGTDHSQITKDYEKSVREDTIIIDGRNFFKTKKGAKLIGVGRILL